jgi:rubredoxin
MSAMIEKIPGGFRVDGLELRNGKCGCTSINRCCYSMSRVKKRSESLFEFSAKMTDPDTADTFEWGYTVEKDGVTVKVAVEDARDKVIYSGFFPPRLEDWKEKGWSVVEQVGSREDGAVWRCSMCKWLHRDDREGANFESLAADWKCPVCKSGKQAFEKIG